MHQLVKINTRPLIKFADAVSGKQKSAHMQAMARSWSVIFLNDMFKRFRSYATGSGDWAPLNPQYAATKKDKRILIKSAEMSRALKPGSRYLRIGDWRVSGGSLALRLLIVGNHKTGVPMADLMGYHQHGTPKMPARPIFADLSTQARVQLEKATTLHLSALGISVGGSHG